MRWKPLPSTLLSRVSMSSPTRSALVETADGPGLEPRGAKLLKRCQAVLADDAAPCGGTLDDARPAKRPGGGIALVGARSGIAGGGNVTLAVQVLGKLRATIEVPAGADEADGVRPGRSGGERAASHRRETCPQAHPRPGPGGELRCLAPGGGRWPGWVGCGSACPAAASGRSTRRSRVRMAVPPTSAERTRRGAGRINIPERSGQVLRRDLERRFEGVAPRRAGALRVAGSVDLFGRTPRLPAGRHHHPGALHRHRQLDPPPPWAVPPRQIATSSLPTRALDSFNIPDLQFFAADSARGPATETRFCPSNFPKRSSAAWRWSCAATGGSGDSQPRRLRARARRSCNARRVAAFLADPRRVPRRAAARRRSGADPGTGGGAGGGASPPATRRAWWRSAARWVARQRPPRCRKPPAMPLTGWPLPGGGCATRATASRPAAKAALAGPGPGVVVGPEAPEALRRGRSCGPLLEPVAGGVR